MASKRERIDRRLSAASAKVLEQPADAVAVFRDGWGEVAKRYDLGKLGLPTDVTMLLADAFRNHHAASSSETHRHCWMALRVFARFAVEDGHVLSAEDLTTAMVGRYCLAGSTDRGTDEQALVKGVAGECADAASPDDRLDEAPASGAAAVPNRLPLAGLAEPDCRHPTASWWGESQGDPARVL